MTIEKPNISPIIPAYTQIPGIWKIADPSISDECKIDDISANLYKRICAETEALLTSQLTALGVDLTNLESIAANCKKTVFPNDPHALAIYEYNGVKILGLRISDNMMCIEFDIPKLESQTKEDQCTKDK